MEVPKACHMRILRSVDYRFIDLNFFLYFLCLFDLPDVHFLLETRHSKWIQRNWLFLKSFYNFLSHKKKSTFIGMGNYLVGISKDQLQILTNSQVLLRGSRIFGGMCLLVCLFGRPMKMDTMIWCKSWNAFGSRIKSTLANHIFPIQPGDAALGCCWGERRKMAPGGSKTQPLRLGRLKGWGTFGGSTSGVCWSNCEGRREFCMNHSG